MDEVFGRFMSWDEIKMECDDPDPSECPATKEAVR